MVVTALESSRTPVGVALQVAAAAASLGAAYRHGQEGDNLAMGTSLLAAVPGLGLIAGKGFRLGARLAAAKGTGTRTRATGGAARAVGGRISLVGLFLLPRESVTRISCALEGS